MRCCAVLRRVPRCASLLCACGVSIRGSHAGSGVEVCADSPTLGQHAHAVHQRTSPLLGLKDGPAAASRRAPAVSKWARCAACWVRLCTAVAPCAQLLLPAHSCRFLYTAVAFCTQLLLPVHSSRSLYTAFLISRARRTLLLCCRSSTLHLATEDGGTKTVKNTAGSSPRQPSASVAVSRGEPLAQERGSHQQHHRDRDAGSSAASDSDSIASYLDDGFEAFDGDASTEPPLLAYGAPGRLALASPSHDEASTVSSEGSTPTAVTPGHAPPADVAGMCAPGDAPPEVLLSLPTRSVSPVDVRRVASHVAPTTVGGDGGRVSVDTRDLAPASIDSSAMVQGSTSALVADLMRSAHMSPRLGCGWCR